MDDEKQIRRVGSACDDLLAFPKDARMEAGFQLGKVQAGLLFEKASELVRELA